MHVEVRFHQVQLVARRALVAEGVEGQQRFHELAGLLDPVEVSPFFRGKEGGLLPLHGFGPLIGHVIGVRRKGGVSGLPVGLRHLVEKPQGLLCPGPFIEEPLLNVSKLFLGEHVRS